MSELKANPIIAAMQRNESAIEVSGYVGKCEKGRVRVYLDLNLGAYLEVDAADVVHTTDAERDDEPARVYVRESADVEVITRTRMKAVALQRDDDESGGGGKTCADKSFDLWWECVRRPGSDIDNCTRASRVAEIACESKRASQFPDVAVR